MAEEPSLEQLEVRRHRATGYYAEVDRLYRSLVSPKASVLEIGCSTGRLLATLNPREGLGLDRDEAAVTAARHVHADRPELAFDVADVETVERLSDRTFDYIILSDLVPVLGDVQQLFTKLRPLCTPSTRVLLNFPSNLWRPLFRMASWLGYRTADPDFNWLSTSDVRNLLYLSNFEVVTTGTRVLLPVRVPGLSWLFNTLLARLPGIAHLCMTGYVVARPHAQPSAANQTSSVSVVIPTRNERGNIEDVFTRVQPMGAWTEFVFVDGHSDDGTAEEIERCIEKYKATWPRAKLLRQTGSGKGQAVRQAFDECTGDVLMILDSDLTMPPEELPKYYEAITSGHGELINGCRLVYPMEKEAMRFLNMIANYLFARLFTWLLGQPIKDTLCGTKVLWKSDYEAIAANRAYFGEFDPFGDFDLLFGAARLQRRIVDLPIRYRERTYGEIKIHRWRHGVLLLRMSWVAFLKLKLS